MTDNIDLKHQTSRFRLLLATGASVVALSLGGAAYAQAVATTTDQAADDDSSKTEELITVTGSRIKRVGVDTIAPAISVSSEELDKNAFTNIADALNEVPAFGNGLTPNGGQNAFTVGQNFVDLFDLGTQRTLTLVDGHRFVSSNVPTTFGSVGGLQVDLNSVPVALVDRVETVLLAGAPIYGSDAIAGTINVILKDDYEGAEFGGQYGVTEKGDFQTYQGQAVFGANTADGRGNSTFSVEYNTQEGGLLTRRPRFTENNPNLVNFGNLDLNGDGQPDDIGGDGSPDTFRRVFFDQRLEALSAGGSVSPIFGVPPIDGVFIPAFGLGSFPDGNFYRFDPNGNLAACTPGAHPGQGSPIFSQGGTCGDDFFDSVSQVRSPLKRLVLTSVSHYDILPNVRAKVETTFANSKARELVNQGGFNTALFSDDFFGNNFVGDSAALRFSTSNPFLTSQARNIIEGNGFTEFALNRFNNDIVNSGENSTENHTWRVVTALEGDFEAAGRHFNWDASGVFGNSDVETRSFGIVDGRFFNAIDAVRVDDALLQGIVNAGAATDLTDALDVLNRGGLSGVSNIQRGSIICRVNANLAAGTASGFNSVPGQSNGGAFDDGAFPFADGCVPLNLFGEGAASPEAIAFINGAPRITSSNIGQRVFTANFGGELLQLPAGWINFNSGFETRRERATFTPGLGTALNITRSSPFLESGGQSKTYEVYGEVQVPIANPEMNIPLLNFMEVDASFRRVNNRVAGLDRVKANSSTDNVWQVGGRWKPVKDIAFRGSFTSAIRSPALVELFSPRVQAFLFANDPCDNRFVTLGPDPATRAANCAAIGIVQPFTSNVVNRTIIGADEGNPNLLPERSHAFNLGGVLTPRWIPNLTVQADYFRINLKNRIAPLSLTNILQACFDSPSFPNNPFCSPNLFQRDASGQIVFGKTTQLNAGLSKFKAVNVQADYHFDVADALAAIKIRKNKSDLGEFAFHLQVQRGIDNKVQVLDELPNDTINTFSDPKYQGTLDTTYRLGPWRVFWRILYQDAPVFNTLNNAFVLDDNDNIVKFGARVIHNGSIAYTIRDMVTVQLGVDNITNRKPNVFEEAAGYFSTTEILGRTYTFRVRSRF